MFAFGKPFFPVPTFLCRHNIQESTRAYFPGALMSREHFVEGSRMNVAFAAFGAGTSVEIVPLFRHSPCHKRADKTENLHQRLPKSAKSSAACVKLSRLAPEP
jgi:hypothetical protein